MAVIPLHPLSAAIEKSHRNVNRIITRSQTRIIHLHHRARHSNDPIRTLREQIDTAPPATKEKPSSMFQTRWLSCEQLPPIQQVYHRHHNSLAYLSCSICRMEGSV